ncbi:BppU family phage baseplate upper protein [Enterococcus sp. ALS3]|uniref:BppU family phage baseplate upper protein n=1 Tax=Enterococcus alishanensis TaxID=1303817 RepID=A0ABS6TDS4_9ENTE|nr:BppU family phage baseplate upper protein [Enterococcus alishanensis]MBV7391047.1 BppU family phage baseplate upper protein [Enterococcus alishanensis]
MANKILNLDLSKDPILPPFIYGRVGDEKLQTITVNITNNDQQFSLVGYTVTFEGVTNGGKTKVFDSDNVKVINASTGTFEYTFPSTAFGTPGVYERAYFSVAKSGVRNSTGDFKIDVSGNADIDAAEAQTIITEYNKLIEELRKLQTENILELENRLAVFGQQANTEFATIQNKITDLQDKIDRYETSVASTANNATTSVNSAKNTAITEISAALQQFNNGDFYTKTEADNKFIRYSEDRATNGEATAGTSTTKWMSPLRVFDAIAKWTSGKFMELTGNQTVAGTKNFSSQPSFNGALLMPLDSKGVVRYKMSASNSTNIASGGVDIIRFGDLVIVTGLCSLNKAVGKDGDVFGNFVPDELVPTQDIYQGVFMCSWGGNGSSTATEIRSIFTRYGRSWFAADQPITNTWINIWGSYQVGKGETPIKDSSSLFGKR